MIARCSVCGSSEFRHGRVLWQGLIDEWQLTSSEVEYIDRQQGTSCQGCGAQLRAIALTQAVQSHLQTTMLLKEIVADRRYQGIRVLDLNGCMAFSDIVSALPGYVRADYPAVDMTAMPYHDSSFDIVVHSDTLEHIPDPVKALTECLRVVTDSGAVCFTVPLIVGRLTRSRDGLPKSHHGSSANKADAIAEWRQDFNTARPHSSLGCQTPAAYAEVITATGSDAVLMEGSAPPPVAFTAPQGVTKTAEALIANGCDYIVHTEFGADFWTCALQAGANSVSICSAEFPAAHRAHRAACG